MAAMAALGARLARAVLMVVPEMVAPVALAARGLPIPALAAAPAAAVAPVAAAAPAFPASLEASVAPAV